MPKNIWIPCWNIYSHKEEDVVKHTRNKILVYFKEQINFITIHSSYEFMYNRVSWGYSLECLFIINSFVNDFIVVEACDGFFNTFYINLSEVKYISHNVVIEGEAFQSANAASWRWVTSTHDIRLLWWKQID